jgi:hypothetical protein
MFYEKEFLDVKVWASQAEGNILFSSGAFGDFFLGIDAAMKHKMSMIYWSKPVTLDLSKNFLSAFKIKSHVINAGIEIWRNKNTFEFCDKLRILLEGRGFRTHGNNKCHLPIINYLPDVVNKEYSDFQDCKLNISPKYCLLCPSGSNQGLKAKRFFHYEEFDKLINLVISKQIEPILVGNENQLARYDGKKKCKWLQFEKFEKESITVKHFIEAVRSAMFVVSPDTSLKTISAAMHIPTFVLKNRNSNNDFVNGIWDRIFLDRKKWKTLECFPYNDLIKKIIEFKAIKML